jgi:flagellar motor switch protein FliG
MSFYTRYKRTSNGVLTLAELWETIPMVKRQKMIDIGMSEDPIYTKQILEQVLTFDEIVNTKDPLLMDILAKAKSSVIANALISCGDKENARFLYLAPNKIKSELKFMMEETKANISEQNGAKLSLIKIARQLQKDKGYSVKEWQK